MNAAAAAPLALDVVSDVVCPWCYIGKRRLEKAVAAAEVAVAVRWRPYQLDPTIQAGGKPRREYLQQKFGSAERIRQIHENISAVGAAEGISFAFDRIEMSPNTLDAHRLVRWAEAEGVQDEIVEALFQAYFTESRDIGDREVLADIATMAGMDRGETAARLGSDEDRDNVRREVEDAQRLGVTGVPTFILAGRYGLVGAQPAEEIARALKQIANDSARTDPVSAGEPAS